MTNDTATVLPRTRTRPHQTRTPRRLARTVAAAAAMLGLLATTCSSDAGTGGADSPPAAPAAETTATDLTGSEVIAQGSIVPASRGEMPAHGLAGVDTSSGERVEAVLPPETPGVVAWSDWCFFDGPDTILTGASQCSASMSSFAFALSHLGADEACVLDQHTKLINALADIEGGDITAQTNAAEDAYGWHRCASVIDPDPTDGRTLTEKCEALPDTKADIDLLYGSCAEWAESRPPTSTPICSASRSLLFAWMDTHHGDEATMDARFDC